MEDARDRFDQFEPLVHEHHVRVRACVRSLGVDRDWVDDVAQEAFMEAFRKWDSFDHQRDFGKWVRGIAANIVRNEVRKRNRRQRLLNSDLAQSMLTSHLSKPEPASPVSLEAVQVCLAKLNADQRALIQGHYYDGLTSGELSDRLQKSAANVRQMLVRVRRQIRACIERQQSKSNSIT
jgi:RNA polymerase sigma-70 factor (ECF subfamily)